MTSRAQKPQVEFVLRGALEGHTDSVTCVCTDPSDPEGIVVSSSRDRSILVWKVTKDGPKFAIPKKSLKGHGHFVSDVKISHNSSFVISSSWDKTLRLWDLDSGKLSRCFLGHTREVLSVSFSALDSRQIASGSADKTVKIWNTRGECKAELSEKGHQDWVTCVRFSPSPDDTTLVSCGQDNVVKVWDMMNFALKMDFIGHKGYLNCVTVSPDGTLCASGGQDGMTMLWDLVEGKYLYCLDTGDVMNALAFSPTRYWLCTASGPVIKIWDLRVKTVIGELMPECSYSAKQMIRFTCTSLAWSSNGCYLYAGYSDGSIWVWSCPPAEPEQSVPQI